MNKLWFIPIFMFLFKLISNTYYFFRIKTLSHHYDEFLYKGNTRILKEASETIDLFKRVKFIFTIFIMLSIVYFVVILIKHYLDEND